MGENYKRFFYDTDFFDRIAKYRKGTFNCIVEQQKLTEPYTQEVKLKDAYMYYEKWEEYNNCDPEEIGNFLIIPKTPNEALEYLIECDGKVSFLNHIEFFLQKYGSFSSTYLRAWMVNVEKKESLSKDHSFINESFEEKLLKIYGLNT